MVKIFSLLHFKIVNTRINIILIIPHPDSIYIYLIFFNKLKLLIKLFSFTFKIDLNY